MCKICDCQEYFVKLDVNKLRKISLNGLFEVVLETKKLEKDEKITNDFVEFCCNLKFTDKSDLIDVIANYALENEKINLFINQLQKI